jgi:uncharacterized LabA/DUF88 family protein
MIQKNGSQRVANKEQHVNANPKNRTLVLIDDANLYYGFKKRHWDLDYERFYRWLRANFNVLEVYFFGGVVSKKAFLEKKPTNDLAGFKEHKENRQAFLKLLKHIGYTVTSKPVTSLYDSTSGQYKRKCNFDVEIAIVAMDKINKYEELILCTGDGDFTKLLKYVKSKHKKATLIAHKDRLNWELEKTANRVIFIESLRREVSKKKGPP